MTRATYQLDVEETLHDAARLADSPAVQANEVRSFGRKRSEVRLAGHDESVERSSKLVEVALHRAGNERGFARGHQDSPPNTSTFVNTQAGEACPTRITWEGSPLPQYGVPSTCTVSSLPTRARLRQNSALIPR